MANWARRYKLVKTIFSLVNKDKKTTFSAAGNAPGMLQKVWQQVSINDLYLAGEIAGLGEGRSFAREQVERIFQPEEMAFVANASIGSVFRVKKDDKLLAVKIKHPGMETMLRDDLRFCKKVLRLMSLMVPQAAGKNMLSLMAELEVELVKEVDYIKEKANHQLFYEIFRDSKQVIIPRIYEEYCTGDIIASDFYSGESLTLFLTRANDLEKRWFLDCYHKFILGSLLNYGLLHADPHPGNFIILKQDGQQRLVVVDYGCVKQFSPEFAAHFKKLLTGIYQDSEQDFGAVLANLGFKDDELSYYRPILSWLLAAIFQPYREAGEMHYHDWKLNYKISSILSSRPWEKPLSMPKEFILLIRAYNALISYWQYCHVQVDWNKTLGEVLEGNYD